MEGNLKYTIDQSSRMAFCALIHDLGKIGQRCQIELSESKKEILNQLYAKRVNNYNSDTIKYYSHQHVSYTALMIEEIEEYLPKNLNEFPFNIEKVKQGNFDIEFESLVNAAALHHKPDNDSLLQWIVAIGDRVSSGFEREEFDKYNETQDITTDLKDNNEDNYIRRRLSSILEVVNIESDSSKKNPQYRVELKPLNVNNMMLVKPNKDKTHISCVNEYKELWSDFKSKLMEIPKSHKENWPLWLDHFDSLFSIYGHAVPASTLAKFYSDVSLYDHSKTTSAIATALWCYYVMNDEYSDKKQRKIWIDNLKNWSFKDEKQFILIQGDFSGIQDYIFSSGNKVNKDLAKLMRGRSFSVSMLTELIALKVLDSCQLPPTSQVISAAGKFLIIAPNHPIIEKIINSIKEEVNSWFWKNTFATSSFSIATLEVGLTDFKGGGKFNDLMANLFDNLDIEKCHKYNNLLQGDTIFDNCYSHGVCDYNKYLPAEVSHNSENININKLSKLQIIIGEELVRKDRILISNTIDAISNTDSTKIVLENFLGYTVALTKDENKTGKFNGLAKDQSLLRCWDYSLPNENGNLWNGYSRKYINGYVAQWGDEQFCKEKYFGFEDQIFNKQGEMKSWDILSFEDKTKVNDGEYIGHVALAVLKGDVDDLGKIFIKGISFNCFAKMVNLSRLINNFFAIYLPYICKYKGYTNVYTVFAGGDDFFLIGSWKTIMELASTLANDFKSYVGNNQQLHFSAGISLFKPGIPISSIRNIAEDSLNKAKKYPNKPNNFLPKDQHVKPTKNSVCIFGIQITWGNYLNMLDKSNDIKTISYKYGLSTGYIYGLLNLCDMAEDKSKPQNSIWRSYFKYRTFRLYGNKDKFMNLYDDLIICIYDGIENYGEGFKIALMHYLYQNR